MSLCRSMSSSVLLDPLLLVAQEPATATAAGISIGGFQYTPDENVVKFLSVAPPILLQFVFFSPLQAVKQFRDTGSTGDVSIMPYSMMVANGVIWFSYGALLSNPTIMLPNVTAILMGLGYCGTFWKYRSPQVRETQHARARARLRATTRGHARRPCMTATRDHALAHLDAPAAATAPITTIATAAISLAS